MNQLMQHPIIAFTIGHFDVNNVNLMIAQES